MRLEGKRLRIYSKNIKKGLQAKEWDPLAVNLQVFWIGFELGFRD